MHSSERSIDSLRVVAEMRNPDGKFEGFNCRLCVLGRDFECDDRRWFIVELGVQVDVLNFDRSQPNCSLSRFATSTGARPGKRRNAHVGATFTISTSPVTPPVRVRGGGGVVRAPGRRPFHQFRSQRSNLPAAVVCEAVQGPRRSRQQPGCSSVRACFHGRRDQAHHQGVVSILHSARSVVAANRRGET